MTTLLLATRNEHKVGEIRALLGEQFHYLTLKDFPAAPEVIEDADTFAGNATKKAVELANWLVTNSKLNTQNSKLLLVQGPLGLNWSHRKFGILPKIENAEITGHNPPRPDRLKLWIDFGIHVAGRPEWIFIKLHTHGGHERDMATLLTDTMKNFFQHALTHYNDGQRFRFHFVTAREMVNIIHAAEDGKSGNAGDYRNHHYRLA